MHNAPISPQVSLAPSQPLFSVSSLCPSPLSYDPLLLPRPEFSSIAKKTRFRNSGDKAAEMLPSAATKILYQISSVESHEERTVSPGWWGKGRGMGNGKMWRSHVERMIRPTNANRVTISTDSIHFSAYIYDRKKSLSRNDETLSLVTQTRI